MPVGAKGAHKGLLPLLLAGGNLFSPGLDAVKNILLGGGDLCGEIPGEGNRKNLCYLDLIREITFPVYSQFFS